MILGRWLALSLVGVVVVTLAFAACVGDAAEGPAGSDASNVGKLGGPCYGNGTCDVPLVCAGGLVCINADSGTPTSDAGNGDAGNGDAGATGDATDTWCSHVDGAAWCEDFDTIGDAAAVGTIATSGDAAPPVISPSDPASPPHSLVVTVDGTALQVSTVTHPIAAIPSSNMTLEFDLKCDQQGTFAVAGAGVSFAQAGASYSVVIGGGNGTWSTAFSYTLPDGGSGYTPGSGGAFTCSSASFHHMLVTITSSPAKATLAIDGTLISEVSLSPFAFGPAKVSLGVGFDNAFGPISLDIDNVVSRVN